MVIFHSYVSLPEVAQIGQYKKGIGPAVAGSEHPNDAIGTLDSGTSAYAEVHRLDLRHWNWRTQGAKVEI